MGSMEDKAKGHGNEAMGKIKQAAGNLTDSDRMRAEGAAQELKGKGQKAVGDVKETVKKAGNL